MLCKVPHTSYQLQLIRSVMGLHFQVILSLSMTIVFQYLLQKITIEKRFR